jgi:hypothetical protein
LSSIHFILTSLPEAKNFTWCPHDHLLAHFDGDVLVGEGLEVVAAHLLGVEDQPVVGGREQALADAVVPHDFGFVRSNDRLDDLLV